MHLDLVDLRLFVNVADCNSLTRGAQRSHMSLPAASVRIKNLEEDLGNKLLYRSSQGVTLTPAGQAMAHHARAVLHQLEQLKGDLHEYSRGLKGLVRVFASTTAITEFLPTVLRQYLAVHPDVSVDLREQLSAEVVRSVIEGKADVGIVSGEVRAEDLDVIPYREDRIVLATARDHQLAGHASVTFAQTLDFDHVGLYESSAIHTFLHQIARDMHRNIKLRIQVSNFEAACRMVEAGVGIGLLPESAASRHRKNMDIAVVPLQDDWALRRMNVCVRSLEFLPAYARDLVELLRQDARQEC